MRTNTYELVKVSDIRPGDVIDLEGDKYADPNTDSHSFEFELAEVEALDWETSDCIVIHTSITSVGFPPENGREFHAHEEEINGWDKALGQFFNPDGTYGSDHDETFLVNERQQ